MRDDWWIKTEGLYGKNNVHQHTMAALRGAILDQDDLGPFGDTDQHFSPFSEQTTNI